MKKFLKWYDGINKLQFILFILYYLICTGYVFRMVGGETPRVYYNPVTWGDVILLPFIGLGLPAYLGYTMVKK